MHRELGFLSFRTRSVIDESRNVAYDTGRDMRGRSHPSTFPTEIDGIAQDDKRLSRQKSPGSLRMTKDRFVQFVIHNFQTPTPSYCINPCFHG